MKKVAIIATSTALLLSAGAGGLAYYLHTKKSSTDNRPAPTNTVNLDKNDPSSQAGRSQPVPVKQDPTQSDPNGGGSGSSSSAQATPNPLTVTMTQANQQGSQLVIRAIIAGTTSGTCTLTLTQAGQPTVTLSAGIDVQATYAICHGFNVPTSQLSTGGSWTAAVVASSTDGRSGQAQQTIGVTK